jgi:signal transduction histidine kinase/ActR/RegA family two-component response regulator
MTWLNDVPVQRKLRIAMLITSTLALLMACGVFLAIEYVGYRRSLVQAVTTLAKVMAENSTAFIAFTDKPGAAQTLDALRTEPQVVAAALYDAEGRLFASYASGGEILPATAPADSSDVEFADGRAVAVQPVVEEGRRLGTLYLRATLTQMYQRMQVYALVVLTVLASSFVLAWVVASILQRTISRPILELAETASAVATGSDYSLRARYTSQDEIGRLTLAFNIMLERTQASVEKVAQARDQALAASRAKDEFLAALSHELRTPLNPVLMLASDAAGNTELAASVRDDFAKIAKHVAMEARLIDDLLDLTRITRGKLALDLRTCDVHTIIHDAFATVQPDVDAKKLAIATELEALKSVVHGDAVRLQQVFWNVLKNAVKFTPENGRIVVRTRLSDVGDRVIVTIQDTGLGMTPMEIDRAFEAFTQGEHGDKGGSHRFGGLGLGLAITRKIIELHHGTISATSSGRDQGSTFAIELPLMMETRVKILEKKAPAPGSDLSTGPRPSASRNPFRVRVLVVEDHAATRTTLAHLLTRRKFDVVTAANLEEARSAVRTQAFDLIVSDIGLPDGSGYTLMAEVRSAQPSTPGIALSGYGMEEDINRSQAAGFDAHLTKPIDIKRLDEVIARLLPNRSVEIRPSA